MLDWVVLNASTVATKTASIECCNILVSDFCLELTQIWYLKKRSIFIALTPTHRVFMNLFFRSEMANFSESEHMVQEYYEVASTDWVLLEKCVDSDGARSHRAIGNDERIRCSSKSALHKYMDELYQVSLSFVSYEKDLRFSEDSSREYCGYKVVAKKISKLERLFLDCMVFWHPVLKT